MRRLREVDRMLGEGSEVAMATALAWTIRGGLTVAGWVFDFARVARPRP